MAHPDDEKLLPTDPADVAWTLGHALLYDKKRWFDAARNQMADITAAHLLEALWQLGYVVMRRPTKMPRNDWPTDPKAG